MKFAYKLQELRKGSGMSQEEFAELLGVSRQSVSKWESGKGYPEIDKLIFISNYFNTSLDLLLKDTQEPIEPTSIKSSRSSKTKKGKSKINLTKPNDITEKPTEPDKTIQNDIPPYADDPLPKKEIYPIQRISVKSNNQVRPVKSYRFGNSKTKKLSKRGLITIFSLCFGIGIGLTTMGIAIANDNYTYYDDYYYTDTTAITTALEITEFNDIYSYEADWNNLYDDDTSSNVEQSMIDSLKMSEKSLLIDENNNVYYSGYDIISTYIEAQNQMKLDLSCSQLYQKYISLNNNDNYIEVYSIDFDEWVVINERMLQIYAEQFTDGVVYQAPFKNDFSNFDILSSDISEYMDCNNSPFEDVFRNSTQSKATVSGQILDLCISAMEDRKNFLSMSRYIINYDVLSSKFELVYCTERGSYIDTFVPKQFLMINVSDLDEENNIQAETEIQDNIIMDNDISQDENVELEAIQETVIYEDYTE